MMTDIERVRDDIEGQRVAEYRDRGDGNPEIVLENGITIQEDMLWIPPDLRDDDDDDDD